MTSLYTRFAASILFPLHEGLKRHNSVALRRAMESSQWWSRDKLQTLQLQRLQSLLNHCAMHVPYWQERLRTLDLTPNDFQTLADLRKLPLLTKADIRAHTESLKADNAQALARFNTGGSSGEPLVFYIGKERVSHDVAAKWRATRWWGVDIGDPELVVWGSPIELGAQDRIKLLRDKLLRTQLLPAFEMSPANLDRFVATIVRVKPKMLFGYPSSLSRIAQHARQQGVALNQLGVKVVFVTSERLYDEQQQMMASTFACPVANGYGGRDAGFIAHQCPQGGMHITAEDIIVEIVDAAGQPQGPGTSGEIVVTHLATGDFPFIRYRTGDIGTLDTQPCSCGRGLPLLKEIQGRSTDFVIAQDGTLMHGLALIYVIRDLPSVAGFKIIQESLDHTRVLLKPGPGFSPADETAISVGLKKRLGQTVNITIEKVSEVPPEKSGKFRYIVSHVPQAQSNAAQASNA
ncbi:MAG: phenylacetate--CoA ligase family protein [Burkholderiaceae bacterium]|nr:MAG: phenylacetate--CoA ligase family protein [Burkholderiaceae bacterium]